jgi:hypothetical protein
VNVRASSASVAPTLRSPTVTPENGWTDASALVGVACVPPIVGARPSVPVTVVVSSVVGVPKPVLVSLSVKAVVVRYQAHPPPPQRTERLGRS